MKENLGTLTFAFTLLALLLGMLSTAAGW